MSYPSDPQYGQGYGGQPSGSGGHYGQSAGAYGQTQPASTPDYHQPSYQQTGYQQTGYQQTGYEQPSYQQAGYQQAEYQQPAAQYSSSGAGYAPQQPRSSRPWLPVVIAVATFLAGLGIGALVRGSEPTPVPSALPAQTVTATTKAPPATETVTRTAKSAPTSAKGTSNTTPIVFDGLWKVGSDIMPGIYLAIVPESSPGCYVAFLRTKDKNDVIQDFKGKPGKTMKAEIPSPSLSPYFYSKDCGFWLLTDE